MPLSTDAAETARAPKPGRKGLVQWQKPMVVMFQAMALPALAGVFFFGWRVVGVLVTACVAAFVVEWVFCHGRGKPVTSAVFVTAGLLALSLPPTIPLWMVAVGSVVAILFGKEVFGGFGRNIFNPAMAGRCFLYVCFPNAMTGAVWLAPGGGLSRWTSEALTGATPLDAVRRGIAPSVAWVDALWRRTGGCLGETSAVLLIVAGLYLVYRRSADWRSMLGAVLGALIFSTVFYLSAVAVAAPPHMALLSGGFLFTAVFMVTDPVSSGSSRATRFVGAFLIGSITVVLRTFGSFPEGAMFALLMVNMFTPLIDHLVKAWTAREKARQKASAAA